MAINSLYIDRIYSKIRNILYQRLLWRYAFGNRVSQRIWEKQFSNGVWDYLYGDSEKQHYQIIARYVENYAAEQSLLDIGCGQGVLYHYLNANSNPINYFGIDISKQAVEIGKKKFPKANFSQLDFDREKLIGKFDIVIFNETLYYFDRPLKTVEKVIKYNLASNGYIIISMCDYIGHDVIWKKLLKSYETLQQDVVENEIGQKWTVAIIKPRTI